MKLAPAPIPTLAVLDWAAFKGSAASPLPTLLKRPGVCFTSGGRGAILLARVPALALVLTALAVQGASASGPPPRDTARPASPTSLDYRDREDGISCKYFDVALGVRWPKDRPEWRDADGTIDGPRPFATEQIDAKDTRRVRRIDVLALVRAWWEQRLVNDGLLIRKVAGGHAIFHSREDPDSALRPQLLLRWPDGRKRYLEPAADASLDCATYLGRGHEPRLPLLQHATVALRFDLAAARAVNAAPPAAAELILVRTVDSPAAATGFEVQAMHVPFRGPPAAPEPGLARAYPGDRGIENDPDVLFVDGFDNGRISPRWTRGMAVPFSVVERDDGLGFVPLSGPALRVTIPRGSSLGLDLRYRFKEAGVQEPQEMYFRYYLRLARTWANASDGGKLPGFAGTYGLAGWGGRPWDPYQGWSMRGSFGLPMRADHPAAGMTLIGTYAYHSKSSLYGEGLLWTGSALAGLIGPDRWVCIEQYLRLNTPGREDGVFKAWVDGRPALTMEGLRLRDNPGIRIQEVWMNVFHGGTRTAPADMHAWIDRVVVARRYIGPAIP